MLTTYTLEMEHWAALGGSTVFMLAVEGYAGFHRRFAPRVAARLTWLCRNCPSWPAILAPLYFLGLIQAARALRLRMLALAVMILGLVFLVGGLSEPWRGIVRGAVAAGLAAGLVSLIYWLLRAACGRPPAVDPGLPPSHPSPRQGEVPQA